MIDPFLDHKCEICGAQAQVYIVDNVLAQPVPNKYHWYCARHEQDGRRSQHLRSNFGGWLPAVVVGLNKGAEIIEATSNPVSIPRDEYARQSTQVTIDNPE